MTPSLLRSLSRLFYAEADAALPDPYAWPPLPPPTAEQLAEHDRLRAIGDEVDERADMVAVRGAVPAEGSAAGPRFHAGRGGDWRRCGYCRAPIGKPCVASRAA